MMGPKFLMSIGDKKAELSMQMFACTHLFV